MVFTVLKLLVTDLLRVRLSDAALLIYMYVVCLQLEVDDVRSMRVTLSVSLEHVDVRDLAVTDTPATADQTMNVRPLS